MACKPVCRLCDRLVLSESVTFTGGNLIVNLPAGSYQNNKKYCVVIAQSIPDTTTINAPVYFTIGAGTTLSNDKAKLRSGHRLWYPYPDKILCVRIYNSDRRCVSDVRRAFLLAQQ